MTALNELQKAYFSNPVVLIGYKNAFEYQQAKEFVNKESLTDDTILLSESDIPFHEPNINYLPGPNKDVFVTIMSFSGFKQEINELEKILKNVCGELEQITQDSSDANVLHAITQQYIHLASTLAKEYSTQISFARYSTKESEKVFAIVPEPVLPYLRSISACELTVAKLDQLRFSPLSNSKDISSE